MLLKPSFLLVMTITFMVTASSPARPRRSSETVAEEDPDPESEKRFLTVSVQKEKPVEKDHSDLVGEELTGVTEKEKKKEGEVNNHPKTEKEVTLEEKERTVEVTKNHTKTKKEVTQEDKKPKTEDETTKRKTVKTDLVDTKMKNTSLIMDDEEGMMEKGSPEEKKETSSKAKETPESSRQDGLEEVEDDEVEEEGRLESQGENKDDESEDQDLKEGKKNVKVKPRTGKIVRGFLPNEDEEEGIVEKENVEQKKAPKMIDTELLAAHKALFDFADIEERMKNAEVEEDPLPSSRSLADKPEDPTEEEEAEAIERCRHPKDIHCPKNTVSATEEFQSRSDDSRDVCLDRDDCSKIDRSFEIRPDLGQDDDLKDMDEKGDGILSVFRSLFIWPF